MNRLNLRVLAMSAAVVAIVAMFVFFLLQDFFRDRRVSKLLERSIADNNIVQQKIDKFGAQVTEASSNYVSRDELRQSDDAVIKAVRKELEGPIRTLDRTTRILSSRIDSLSMPVTDTTIIVNGQAVDGRAFSFKNEWVDISGLCSVDSVWLNYTIRADYKLEYHWKTKSLFGPKELVLFVRSADPAIRVNAIQQFTIAEPTPWYGKPLPVGVAGFASGLLVGLILDNKNQ